ncbi:TniQ family protein [Frondihabitans australicus]|uniref:TniQ protein n=1 Tax=Frondihabitans australicus TaxID=386892 RepID=A0A495IIU0_9MICO|nr:TniQ family protein [Frondihabitans australicus]RKR75897.1 TniQ protein [Frondihabitans australicus]
MLHLPIVVWPEPGESFQSWIRRYAFKLRVSPLDLYRAFDLDDREISFLTESHGYGLDDTVVARICESTGIDPDTMHATTFDRYEHLPEFEFDETKRLRRLRNWVKGSHTRFCVECLRESGGVFLVEWQTSWTFACVRHNVVLTDWCPECQGPVPVSAPVSSVAPDPLMCQRRLPSDGDFRRQKCAANLADAFVEKLPETHPLIDAQIFVTALFDQSDTPAAGINLADLKALCVGLLKLRRRAALELKARLPPGALAGLEPERVRDSSAAPEDALFFGALVVSAKALMMGNSSILHNRLREIAYGSIGTVNSEAGFWWKDGPSTIISRFGGTVLTRRRLAHAIDKDLTPRQRIWYGSALPPNNLPLPAASKLPETLWPEWVYALDPGGRHTREAVRMTLDATINLYGEHDRCDSEARSGVHPRRPSTNAKYLMNGVLKSNADGEGDFIEAVARLIAFSHEHPPLTSFSPRLDVLRLLGSGFLPDKHWHALRESILMPRNSVQASDVRAYAFERLTGVPVRTRGPYSDTGWPAIREGTETRFALEMTQQLQEAIDQYLAIVLDEARLDGPVRDVAPLSLLPPRLLPRGTIGALDLGEFHTLLVSGERTLTTLARAAGINPRDVPIVAATRPPGHPKYRWIEIDWNKLRREVRSEMTHLRTLGMPA